MNSPIDRHRPAGAILPAVLLTALLMAAGCSDEVTGADPPATHPLVVYEPPDAGGWIPQNGTFHA
ncbi:hypothetical protein GF314_02025, partial [bacterium]|nr:hypothetical protein [bacterium]